VANKAADRANAELADAAVAKIGKGWASPEALRYEEALQASNKANALVIKLGQVANL
jgi:hypothetical protein